MNAHDNRRRLTMERSGKQPDPKNARSNWNKIGLTNWVDRHYAAVYAPPISHDVGIPETTPFVRNQHFIKKGA